MFRHVEADVVHHSFPFICYRFACAGFVIPRYSEPNHAYTHTALFLLCQATLPSLRCLLIDGADLAHIPAELASVPNLTRTNFSENPRLSEDPTAAGILKSIDEVCHQNKGWCKYDQ
jgi:hypothetical protein